MTGLISEEWKDVKGFDGKYMVSNLGRVMGFNLGKQKVLKPYVNNYGYSTISPTIGGKTRPQKIHRLVALAFVDGFDKGLQVNHKDGDKQNNCAVNLEWTTGRENVRHSYIIGLSKRGENHGMAKRKNVDIIAIRKMANDGLRFVNIGKMYGVSSRYIGAIVNRKIWRHI